MKVEIISEYVIAGQDVNTGDLIEILNEGEITKGDDKIGPKMVIKVKIPKGIDKKLTLNETSKKEIIEKYGDESTAWIGKQLKVKIAEMNVAGQFKKVIYVAPV